jgi:hypothetical protein
MRRALTLLLCTTLLLDPSGCTRPQTFIVRPEAATVPMKEWIIGVTTRSGEVVEFDTVLREGPWGDVPGGTRATLRNDSLFAKVDKEPYSIALADVQHIWIQKETVDPWLTAAGVTVGVLFVALIVTAIVASQQSHQHQGSSCPLVYSWNGNHYIFDAEPFPGAITRGVERDDLSELENLQPVDGSYRVHLRNEMPETDYANRMELWVVDHPPATRVAAGASSEIYALGPTVPPASATDASGRDLRGWLEATDRRIWEPAPVPADDGSVRSEIVMTFPRPAGANQARLVANVSTGTWGAWMIRELLDLRGNQLEGFNTVVDASPAARESLQAWNEREELFLLKLEVEEPDGWHVRGFLPGGAQAPETRVIPLDIHRVEGEQLRIRIRPPVGFWALNSFAVDYSHDPPLQYRAVAPRSAVDDRGNDVLPQLLQADDAYYVMPEPGDGADVVFSAPRLRTGLRRTIFLHSRGYYLLHLPQDHPPDTATLDRIAREPDAAASFAVEKFRQLQTMRAGATEGRR